MALVAATAGVRAGVGSSSPTRTCRGGTADFAGAARPLRWIRWIWRTAYDPLGVTRIPGAEGHLRASRRYGIFVNAEGTFRVVLNGTGAFGTQLPRPRLGSSRCAPWPWVLCRRTDRASPASARIHGKPGVCGDFQWNGARPEELGAVRDVDRRAFLAGAPHVASRSDGCSSRSGLILLLTLALGGLLFGTLNVLSVGFAAVLLGLAVDYGLVSYREAVACPGATPAEVRREVSRGVWYSAGTTARNLLLLGFVGLPGLARLGQLGHWTDRGCPGDAPFLPAACVSGDDLDRGAKGPSKCLLGILGGAVP